MFKLSRKPGPEHIESRSPRSFQHNNYLFLASERQGDANSGLDFCPRPTHIMRNGSQVTPLRINAPVLSAESPIQPLGGLAEPGQIIARESDGPDLTTRTVRIGDIGDCLGLRAGRSAPIIHTQLAGSGVGLDAADALPRALGEAVERYCASAFREEQIVRSAALDLGAEALDLDWVPRCSKTELSNPRCPLRLPDKRAVIRWVRGLSLLDGSVKYLPAVMTYLYTGILGEAEQFWLPISTGCAAHRSYAAALTGATCEVIERDALSIAWLQELPLPRLEFDRLGGEAAIYWERFQRASTKFEYFFFDATTDLGVPAVLGIQVCPVDRRRTTLVACGCAPDAETALTKVLREMVAHRVSTRQPQPVPSGLDECTGLTQDAALMACAEQTGAFGFLLHSGARRKISEVASAQATGGQSLLSGIIGRFGRRGLDVFAADLTTDEALRCGLKAVRVLIPSLQPFSYHYRARYLGHSRLYDAPRRMGYKARPEPRINAWPIPFA